MKQRNAEMLDPCDQTSVECLLGLGRLARQRLRHGYGLDQVSRELRVGGRACLLALAFLAAPDALKFRALVENWNLLSVRATLRRLKPPFPL